MTPRYPIYVISKGRADCCLTAGVFERDGVDFRLVVEPQEADAYAEAHGRARLLITPFQSLGQGSIPARNFVWEHGKSTGAARHWIFDDNIKGFLKWHRGGRLYCASTPAICVAEDFTDRYENIGITGFNYNWIGARQRRGPFTTNCHVYSSLLIKNDLPYRWRGRYNEDTDLCLQVLAGGLCTVLIHAFMIFKVATMTMKGGNTTELYDGDGRLKMARALERKWPGVATVSRRWKRPQHVVDWTKFDTPLIRRKDVDFDAIPPDDYGLRLVQVDESVRSPRLRAMLDESEANHGTTAREPHAKVAAGYTAGHDDRGDSEHERH